MTSDLDCAQLAELHGLFRHWGHPTVNEELGCEKTRIIGQTKVNKPDKNGWIAEKAIICFIPKQAWKTSNNQEFRSFCWKTYLSTTSNRV